MCTDEPPFTPTNLKGTPLTGGVSVRLTWTQSGSSVVDSYDIYYSKIDGCSSAPLGSASYTGSETEFTLTGLQEAVGYEISIAAVNHAGFSQRSDPYRGTTLATGEC